MTLPPNPIVPVVAGTSPLSPHFFEVACVEKTHAPDGGNGQNWYRYVLKSRSSTITGQRRGSRKDVHSYATECAQQLNLRAATSQSIWNPRGRKPTPTPTPG
jgi:hypothetical protein